MASFHGGDLATDAPTSPHLRVAGLADTLYIAAAYKDDSYSPAMAARMEDALAKAGVPYQADTYSGAMHGWMVPDFPVHDAAATDRVWAALLALFDRTLQA